MATSIKALLPAGKYFIGDFCNVLDAKTYDEVTKKIVLKNNVLMSHMCEIDGKKIVYSNTTYGDGMYKDNQGRKYAVDSGIISIVPYELCKSEEFEPEKCDYGTIYDFTSEVVFGVNKGVFTIQGKVENRNYLTRIIIDTN